MMDDLRPVDFGALDPWNEPGRYDRAVDALVRRASAELERRAARQLGPLGALAGWLRPALAAAAVVCAVSVGVLARPAPAGEAAAAQRITDELGLGGPVSLLAVEEQPPTDTDLIHAVEDPR